MKARAVMMLAAASAAISASHGEHGGCTERTEKCSVFSVKPSVFSVRATGRSLSPSRLVSLDSGWSYSEDSTHWQPVTLPHTWNATDAVDPVPGYRRDVGWYRRSLDVRRYAPNDRILMRFESANTVADVYVNGRRAGGHAGGYIGFSVDVTDYVRRDAPNDVRVRVSNAEDARVIPSGKQDFVIYGGLTRDVWLDVRPALSIERLAIRTPSVDSARGSGDVRVVLRNPARRRGSVTVALSLAEPNGRVITRGFVQGQLAGDTLETLMPPYRLDVARPALWSPDTPSLYTVRASLGSDSIAERFGFRWARFDSGGAFHLNGQRLLIRGTHRHEEMAGVGAALSNAQHRADMAAIKAMGANWVRLAHYPQDPEVYRAADSLGLLLWDELPWGRGGVGNAEWKANTRRLLIEQVAQNGNHPSIVVWSMGNEVADVLDATDSSYRTNVDSIAAFMRELSALSHAVDPTRPTATRKFDAGNGWRSVDVYSPSIWAGWYGGVYRDYEKSITNARQKFPRMVHMEYGADAHYGRHTETPISGEGLQLDTGTTEKVGKRVANVAREGDWSESYQTDLLDWHLMVSEHLANFTGNAQWAFRDFATPLRPENPIPYVNEKGLVTRDGVPKDAYYVFKSRWTTSPKFAYIVSHAWPERSGPVNAPRDVRVYSNCDAVTLVANGVGLGERRREPSAWPAQGLVWPVKFRSGANTLDASCVEEESARDTLTVRYTWETAGKPDHIVMSAHALPDGRVLVEARLVDAQGRTALASRDRVYFAHDGAGTLVVDQGTPTGSRVIEAANGVARIVVVRAPNGDGGVVEARTQDINGSRVTIGRP